MINIILKRNDVPTCRNTLARRIRHPRASFSVRLACLDLVISDGVHSHVKAKHTLLETAKDDVRLLHVDFAKKVHVREAFYHFFLPILWNGVVKCSYDELE